MLVFWVIELGPVNALDKPNMLLQLAELTVYNPHFSALKEEFSYVFSEP